MRARRVISTIDAHAAGEPLRIITAGAPRLTGTTMLERRQELLARHDDLRRVLLFEPRGHADMYGAILTPPVTPEADYGVLFLTNEGYSSMCGHGVIALTTTLLETGMFPAAGPAATITYDAPAGLIRAHATLLEGEVTSVAFENVPAFQYAAELPITAGGQTLRVDVAWGGAFYALVDAAALGLTVAPGHVHALTAAGMAVKHAVEAAIEVRHPAEPGLAGLYGTIITGPPADSANQGRNITIYAEGAVDRSPCGTGTSARLANLHARGELGIGEPYRHESVIGTTFTGRILAETVVADRPAVVTEISGQGFITGFHQFVVDPADPTANGFLVR